MAMSMRGCCLHVIKSSADREVLATLRIAIKAFAAFDTQVTGRHHIDEQGAGRIFGVAKTILEDAQDRQTNIQPDKIGQLQGTHGMRHAKLHDGIDLTYTGYTFIQAIDSLVDHRHEYAISDKAGVVV